MPGVREMTGYGSDITAYNMETPGEEPEEFEDDSQRALEEQGADRLTKNFILPAPHSISPLSSGGSVDNKSLEKGSPQNIKEPMKFVYEDGMLQECKNPKCNHFFHLVVIANNPKEKHEK